MAVFVAVMVGTLAASTGVPVGNEVVSGQQGEESRSEAPIAGLSSAVYIRKYVVVIQVAACTYVVCWSRLRIQSGWVVFGHQCLLCGVCCVRRAILRYGDAHTR